MASELGIGAACSEVTLDWLTPAGRYNGTSFIDRGFENIPALVHLKGWLKDLMDVA